MTANINTERGKRFLKSLPDDLEDPTRAATFHSLLRDSIDSEWARGTAIAVYHLAGSGEWEIASLYDLNMIATALTQNLDLVPVVQNDVERIFQRYTLTERRTRTTWDYVLRLFSAKTTPQCA